MKKKNSIFILTIFVLFCFIVFLKGLNNSNTYVPSEGTGKKLLSFNAKKLLNNEDINSDEFFDYNRYCILAHSENELLKDVSICPSSWFIFKNSAEHELRTKLLFDDWENLSSKCLSGCHITPTIGNFL